jgi:hypothetical protein
MSLVMASAVLANAQCYQFNGSGATLKVNITGFNLSNPPVTIAGGRSASYLFSSSNSLTIGGSTQTSNSIFDGAITIEYLPPTLEMSPNSKLWCRMRRRWSRLEAANTGGKRNFLARGTYYPTVSFRFCRRFPPGSFRRRAR